MNYGRTFPMLNIYFVQIKKQCVTKIISEYYLHVLTILTAIALLQYTPLWRFLM